MDWGRRGCAHGILVSNMEASLTPRRRRILPVLLMIGAAFVIIPAAWFVWQTALFYHDIRSGDGLRLEDRRLEASISSAVANANVTPADLARIIPSVGLYPELGNANARVTIVEFVDYQCPFCQRTAPIIRRILASMGDRVRFTIRDFPILALHPTSKQSALASNCVLAQGQEKYWAYHDLLFADVTDHSPATLRAKAELAGVDGTAFDLCVTQERYLKKIDKDIEDALRAGVQGTPTFFVNGVKIQGALDEKTLTRVINTVMEQLPQ